MGKNRTILYCCCFIGLLLLGGQKSNAQDSLFNKLDNIATNIGKQPPSGGWLYRAFKGIRDSISFREINREVEAEMASKGYLEFALDTFRLSGDTLYLQYHLGNKYYIEGIRLEGFPENLYDKLGFGKTAAKRRAFDRIALEEQIALALKQYQDRGYPFASFDSLQAGFRKGAQDSLLGTILYRFRPGKLFRIDSILIEGEKREKDIFVHALTGIYPGDIYDQSRIDNIPKVLNNSIYFRDVKPAKVEFDERTANLRINLKARKSGKFDVLLGVLPPKTEGAKLQFSGLADLVLVSPIFRVGEILQLRYDKLPGTSQKLHLKYLQPYLFSTPLQLEGEFDLLKQDTLFLTRFFQVAGSYALSPFLSLKAWYKGKTSTLISTIAYEQDSLRTPPVLDGRDQTYGLGFLFDNRDYRFNPTSGFRISADFGIGRKRVLQNPALSETIYRNLRLNLPKREADFSLDYYRRLARRIVLRAGNRTYWLDQEQYFENDLRQIGGSRNLRGFNENEFFADFYTLFSLEPRFLLEQNSYLFVFGDYAYLQNQAGTDRILRPWGVGIGMTYETKVGMVSLTYAVGQVKDISFQPSRGRIHIGLINQF